MINKKYINFAIIFIILFSFLGCNNNTTKESNLTNKNVLISLKGNKNDVKLKNDDIVSLIFVPGKQNDITEIITLNNNVNIDDYFHQYAYVLSDIKFQGYEENNLLFEITNSQLNGYNSFLSSNINGSIVVIKEEI